MATAVFRCPYFLGSILLRYKYNILNEHMFILSAIFWHITVILLFQENKQSIYANKYLLFPFACREKMDPDPTMAHDLKIFSIHVDFQVYLYLRLKMKYLVCPKL